MLVYPGPSAAFKAYSAQGGEQDLHSSSGRHHAASALTNLIQPALGGEHCEVAVIARCCSRHAVNLFVAESVGKDTPDGLAWWVALAGRDEQP